MLRDEDKRTTDDGAVGEDEDGSSSSYGQTELR